MGSVPRFRLGNGKRGKDLYGSSTKPSQFTKPCSLLAKLRLEASFNSMAVESPKLSVACSKPITPNIDGSKALDLYPAQYEVISTFIIIDEFENCFSDEEEEPVSIPPIHTSANI